MYKNKAFTLSEILIAMAIIGVTMIAGYSAFRNHEERAIAHSYAKAYKTLATAAYNIQNEVVEHNKSANYAAQEAGNASADPSALMRFPLWPIVENPSGSASNALPLRIAKLDNSAVTGIKQRDDFDIDTDDAEVREDGTGHSDGGVGSGSGSSDDSSDGGGSAGGGGTSNTSSDGIVDLGEIPDVSRLVEKLKEYINNKGSYSSPPEAFANFDNFIASDGMIYYFDPTPIQKFYVVWVDINGTRHPNTSSARNAKYPDIVPFLVHSELGEVVPAGYPAYNSKYSVSRIIYSDPEKDLSYSSVMTFSEAQSSAYGNTSFAQDSFSQTRSIAEFDNTLPEGFVKPIKSQDSTNCGLGGYQEASDFPPCTVQVNTKF